ncbi:MAG: FCSD flavin-binding domain-containing protein [Gammaproteobacteria bacterium]
MFGRRTFLAATGAAVLAPLCAHARRGAARVVVVGGGFGGATAARYLRLADPSLDVTLIADSPRYTCCPRSNDVIAGAVPLAALERGYERLRTDFAVRVIVGRAIGIDADRARVRLAGGGAVGFDRVVAAPGIDLRWGSPQGYDRAAAARMPHAWRAGAQTLLLRRQLRAMGDGGVFAIAIPPRPFRCPPGPYERAGLVAAWLGRHKPRSKVLVLDANDGFTKQALFLAGWQALYPGRVEWVPLSADGAVRRVDPRSGELFCEAQVHRPAVANVIPAQAAARIALDSDLVDATGWCPVRPQTFESSRVPGVHVIGDACIAEPMPKSASAAASQAKACALAVAALAAGQAPPPVSLHNTCYSELDADYAISINAIYRVADGRIVAVPGSGGTSPADAGRDFRAAEARNARGWFRSIAADAFGE